MYSRSNSSSGNNNNSSLGTTTTTTASTLNSSSNDDAVIKRHRGPAGGKTTTKIGVIITIALGAVLFCCFFWKEHIALRQATLSFPSRHRDYNRRTIAEEQDDIIGNNTQQQDEEMMMMMMISNNSSSSTSSSTAAKSTPQHEQQQHDEFPRDPTTVNQLFDSIENSSNTMCHIRNLPSGDIPKIFDKSTYVFGPTGWHDQDQDQPIEHNNNSAVSLQLVGNHFYPLSDYNHLQVPGGVTLFQDAFVGGVNPMIFDCHTTYFPGGCIYHHPPKPHYNISETKTFFPLQRLVQSRLQFRKLKGHYQKLPDLIHLEEGTVVMIAASHSNNVYHSLVENLLRLVQLAEFLQQQQPSSKQQQEGAKVTILAQGQILMKDDTHRTFFNPILGLQPNQIPWMHYETHQKVYHVKRLLIPTPTHCGVANPTMVQKFQDMFTNALQEKRLVLPSPLPPLPNPTTTTTHKQKNIPELILIHKREKRGFINYSEFLQALKDRFQQQQNNTDNKNRHYYQIVEYTGRESMAMTASLHRNARIVIGPHGAGFSNLIYCQRNITGVVEIHSSIGNGHTMAWAASHPTRAKGPHSNKRGSPNKCHQFTANAAGLPTRFIQMKKKNNMKNATSTEFKESFLIEDIPLVLDTIQELLQEILGYDIMVIGTKTTAAAAAAAAKKLNEI